MSLRRLHQFRISNTNRNSLSRQTHARRKSGSRKGRKSIRHDPFLSAARARRHVYVQKYVKATARMHTRDDACPDRASLVVNRCARAGAGPSACPPFLPLSHPVIYGKTSMVARVPRDSPLKIGPVWGSHCHRRHRRHRCRHQLRGDGAPVRMHPRAHPPCRLAFVPGLSVITSRL